MIYINIALTLATWALVAWRWKAPKRQLALAEKAARAEERVRWARVFLGWSNGRRDCKAASRIGEGVGFVTCSLALAKNVETEREAET